MHNYIIRSGQDYVTDLLRNVTFCSFRNTGYLNSISEINDDFIVKGVSGMDPVPFTHGRPYGIYYRKILSSLISLCQVASKHCSMHFMHSYSLMYRDLNFPNIEYTYESDCGVRHSWVDHVLISSLM